MVRIWLALVLALVACNGGGKPADQDTAPRVASAAPTAPADAATSGTAPMTNTAPPDSPAVDLVRRLVAKPPTRMSELEAIVGPIDMSFKRGDHDNMGHLTRPRLGASGEFTPLVPRLTVNYHWDKHHQDPSKPRDVSFEDFSLEVRGDAAHAEQILQGKHGAPQRVVDGRTTYAAYHPFYLTRDTGAADRFRIVWYDEVPRFAIPVPDPQARTAWLKQLAQRIATARSVDEIDAFCKAAPAAAGIKLTGTLNNTANPYGRPTQDARDYWISFVPPVRAKVLAGAFGWGPIVGVTHDVHMSSWHVERQADSWYPTSGADAQWQIDAGFSRAPGGGRVKRGTGDATGVTDDDELRTLSVQPRFK